VYIYGKIQYGNCNGNYMSMTMSCSTKYGK